MRHAGCGAEERDVRAALEVPDVRPPPMVPWSGGCRHTFIPCGTQKVHVVRLLKSGVAIPPDACSSSPRGRGLCDRSGHISAHELGLLEEMGSDHDPRT
jgi:hypothetical protein